MTEELWTPVRYVHQPQTCDFYWSRIAPGKPGSTTGTRGTKAWFCQSRNVWECLECRSEATRAQIARESIGVR